MSELMNNKSWTVEFNNNVLTFINFSSAIAYADGAASTRALIKVIEPGKNNIKVVPERHQLAAIENH
jgi:hypothetical protein